MVRTLVTGATGTLGTAVQQRLAEAGHTVRAASRSPPQDGNGNIDWVELDVVEETNFETALEDVDVVIHAATAPQGETEAVDVRGTKRLLDAAEESGVENFVYPSIVGIDEIPFDYYQQKLAAETAVEASDLPSTIVRATQFHSFVADMLGYVTKLPIWPLPTKIQLQPVDVREVADRLVNHATPTASGRIDPIGGPEIQSVRHLATAYREARGLRRPIIRLPIPGKTVAAFRAGHATCPGDKVGTHTWQAWLTERYRNDGDETGSRAETPTGT